MVVSFKSSERTAVDPEKIKWLHLLVSQGEGFQLEFKTKATQPDKIVHELIAFANTKGGILLIGVNDDGYISGVKYPEEESLLVMRNLIKHCRPRIKVRYEYIRLTEKKWVIVFEVRESNRKPIKYQASRNSFVPYIRFEDKTLQASPEAIEILRLMNGRRGITITYGDVENKLLKILTERGSASLAELSKISGIPQSTLSKKIVLLAAAKIIGWKPGESSDIFHRI